MTQNEIRNGLKVMVLSDLAATCKKLAENPDVPNLLRTQARELVDQFNLLVPVRGQGTSSEHAVGEMLLIKMAHFLPRIVEIESWPAESSDL